MVLAAAMVGTSFAAFVSGIALGLGAAMPIGPVNVEIARRVIRYGRSAGAALGLGAVTVDVTYALLSTLSFTQFLTRPSVVKPLAAAGAMVLVYLGIASLRAARQALRVDPLANGIYAPSPADEPAARSGHAAWSAYATGVVMTLLNPMTLLFWFAVVGAQAGGITHAPPTAVGTGGAVAASRATGMSLVMMCAGVFTGTLAWVVVFSRLIAWAMLRRRAADGAPESGNGQPDANRRRRWLARADAIGGAMLLAFAGVALWRLFRPSL